MFAADSFNCLLKPANCAMALVCLLLTQTAAANSAPRNHPQPSPAAPHALNLSLPESVRAESMQSGKGFQLPVSRGENTDNVSQFLAGGKKPAPVNMDCGMDLLQTSNPDVALTSRLSGECDFKYHY